MEKILTTESEIQEFLANQKFAALYFSTDECNVCKVLKPKLKDFLAENFSNISFAYINVNNSKECASQRSIFTVPTILFILEGKELIRKARHINFTELYDELSRIYRIIFD